MPEPTTPTPQRPPAWQEAIASRLFRAVAPRLPTRTLPPPPPRYLPFEEVFIPRSDAHEVLTATWYPARTTERAAPRGAVLCLHPWLVWGRAYFHRRGRLEAIRRAGYHVLAVDFPGFGGSGPPAGFFDRDVEDALTYMARRVGLESAPIQPGGTRLPLHLWGVSSGGYWAHLVLSRDSRVLGAMFEDVSFHLLEWSHRMAPWGKPCYRVFERCFRHWHRYLDLRQHAPALQARAVAYVSGELDPGVLPEETRQLAELAGGHGEIVRDADHLEAIKRQPTTVIELALATFARAEAIEAVARSNGSC